MERRIFAHRGLNRVAPENSLAAFEKTADAGLTWIETDVDILGDGTPIVIHDTSLDRTTNRSGSYYGLEKADLASIDAGSWCSPEFAGQPLPTLEQLIELLNRRGLNANIEIKSNEAGGAMSMRLIDSILDAPLITCCWRRLRNAHLSTKWAACTRLVLSTTTGSPCSSWLARHTFTPRTAV